MAVTLLLDVTPLSASKDVRDVRAADAVLVGKELLGDHTRDVCPPDRPDLVVGQQRHRLRLTPALTPGCVPVCHVLNVVTEVEVPDVDTPVVASVAGMQHERLARVAVSDDPDRSGCPDDFVADVRLGPATATALENDAFISGRGGGSSKFGLKFTGATVRSAPGGVPAVIVPAPRCASTAPLSSLAGARAGGSVGEEHRARKVGHVDSIPVGVTPGEAPTAALGVLCLLDHIGMEAPKWP